MDQHRWQIVIASSVLETRRKVMQILDRLGVEAICVSTVAEYRQIAKSENVGLVFCDRSLNDGGYQEVLAAANSKSARGASRVVLMSATMEPGEYRKARQTGLFEVIAAPCRPTDVEWMVILAKRDERKRIVNFIDTPPPRLSQKVSD